MSSDFIFEHERMEKRKKSGVCSMKFFLRPPQVCTLTKTKWPKFFGVKETLLPYVWEGKKKVKVVMKNGLPLLITNFTDFVLCSVRNAFGTKWNGLCLSTFQPAFEGSLEHCSSGNLV